MPTARPQTDLSGVIFDRLKPDGETHSALSVIQNLTSYMVADYSRWVEFWPVADRLLQEVCDVAVQDTPVSGLILIANNRFEHTTAATEIDVTYLLRSEPRYVAQHVLNCRGPRHSFHGYNIDSNDPPGQRTDNVFLVVANLPDGRSVMDLNFNIRLALANPIRDARALFGTSGGPSDSFLGKALFSMHELNKRLLRDIVNESVATLIPGL